MITISPQQLLIGILLIALIVLVIFLIVLISNATDTIKKANAIIDGSMDAASSAKAKVDEVSANARANAAKANAAADMGVQLAQKFLDKILG